MIRIVHLADIHVRNLERHEEYQVIFQKIYDQLIKIKPKIKNYLELGYTNKTNKFIIMN